MVTFIGGGGCVEVTSDRNEEKILGGTRPHALPCDNLFLDTRYSCDILRVDSMLGYDIV